MYLHKNIKICVIEYGKAEKFVFYVEKENVKFCLFLQKKKTRGKEEKRKKMMESLDMQ